MTAWRIDRNGASIVLSHGAGRERIPPHWFLGSYWRERGLVVGEEPGRGAVLFVRHGEEVWALRHYRRGGAAARLTTDRYLWTGLERSRAFREWRLLRALHAEGLPVPNPVAAHVRRSGPSYRGDLITERIDNTRSLASMAVSGELPERLWENIGTTLRRFHDRGADHADLNAHNILLDDRERVFLVDFDRGGLRGGEAWKKGNLDRLLRSLRKNSRETGAAFDEAGWRRLLRGYRSRR